MTLRQIIKPSWDGVLTALVLSAILLSLVGCGSGDKKQINDLSERPANPDWINEEILVQLRDIREEVKGLRSEVAELKEQLDNVQVAAAPSAGRAQPAAVSSIPVNGARRLGDEDATVAVLEFTDFQCPYCKRHHDQSFVELKTNYVDTGKVQYLSMDFPLSFHPQAHSAAVAARCAGKQEKYWEMHDVLFDNNRNLGDAFYKQAAAQLGLNAGEFESCLQDAAVAKGVDQDMIAGSRYGVQGTPAFFLGRVKNGQLTDVVPMRGAQSYEAFARVLNTLLD